MYIYKVIYTSIGFILYIWFIYLYMFVGVELLVERVLEVIHITRVIYTWFNPKVMNSILRFLR